MKPMSEERWKWYHDYEGIAQVSTRGQVKTVDRWVTDSKGRKYFIRGRILKPRRNQNDGYLQVCLCRNDKRRLCLVHRMVAETFIPNPENKPQVNHIDENKENNDVTNLEWVTAKENNTWGTVNKRRSASMLNGSQSKAVLAVDPKTGEVVMEFPSTSEAERNGFHSGHISACCRGKLRTHKGYIWRYK